MRIPLDYYRILGLPIQATAEQLVQGHRDRTLQLPRAGYSSVAIGSRKKLLDEAYSILSDQQQRQNYDTSFLAKSYLDITNETSENDEETQETKEEDNDPHTPSIEIEDDQFVGVLLILQELGEYELVLKLGRSYLNSSINLKPEKIEAPHIIRSDIVLTVALAYLELGREQWQQGQYENAAGSLEAGQAVLLREGLFASVRGEMQSDILRLRPYRILELLANEQNNPSDRRKGLQLLRDMLQERGGIDGNKADGSGLSTDDFLRFIQQLRSHLTALEQQNLFEVEARRPSAVATYLAVYALLAQGFAYSQPELVHRAKLMLMRLGRHQDVHLEVAICSMLLGQTEEASQALELSQEYEPLEFIREHSEDSPDLLPGLCLYGERWLQGEVFPYFRDLVNKTASLKDYFADMKVQAYLEKLPMEEENANQWVPVQQKQQRNSGGVSLPPAGEATSNGGWNLTKFQNTTNSLISNLGSPNPPSISTLPPRAQRIASRERLNGENEGDDIYNQNYRSQRQRGEENNPDQEESQGEIKGAAFAQRVGTGRSGANIIQQVNNSLENLLPALKNNQTSRLIILAVIGLVSIGIIGFIASKTLGWIVNGFSRVSEPKLAAELPGIYLDQAVINIPTPTEITPISNNNLLTETTSKELIQSWLSVKAEVFGKEHKIERLKDILIEPALSEWQKIAEESKKPGFYRKYDHNVSVNSVTTNEKDSDRAKVEAVVSETTEFYEGDKLSYTQNDKQLKLIYSLVRQNGQWRIKEWEVKK